MSCTRTRLWNHREGLPAADAAIMQPNGWRSPLTRHAQLCVRSPPQLPVSSALPAADPSAHPRLASGRAGSQIPRWAAGSWAAFNVSARTKCGEDPGGRPYLILRRSPASHRRPRRSAPLARVPACHLAPSPVLHVRRACEARVAGDPSSTKPPPPARNVSGALDE
ncbi:hypothetical protein ACCO45_005114 [Purpureocillium lilacinum]|uniref:Uncharacterized protein n=1 Tax=Purpureocillium lilacinum TaxID=33203 RepID=A0ACC4DV71_PURLI